MVDLLLRKSQMACFLSTLSIKVYTVQICASPLNSIRCQTALALPVKINNLVFLFNPLLAYLVAINYKTIHLFKSSFKIRNAHHNRHQ